MFQRLVEAGDGSSAALRRSAATEMLEFRWDEETAQPPRYFLAPPVKAATVTAWLWSEIIGEAKGAHQQRQR
jgi:hypothetical protein